MSWTQKWGNLAQIAAAFASLTTMGAAIYGLTQFSPVFRNLQLSEENARISLENSRIEAELFVRRDERLRLEAEIIAAQEEIRLKIFQLEEMEQNNRNIQEEVEHQRAEAERLSDTNQRVLDELGRRRVELNRLEIVIREQRTAAWGYVCNRIRDSASSRLERNVSETGLRLLLWTRLHDVEPTGLPSWRIGLALFVNTNIQIWTETLTPDLRGEFSASMNRFLATHSQALTREYLLTAQNIEDGFVADQEIVAQLRNLITRFGDECRASLP
jgi:hypothetical protein